MSGTTTVSLIKAYFQEAQVTHFLSGFFQSPPGNFHNTEEVEIDIVRSEEDIAVAIADLSVGYRMNAEDIYTNKGFKPPILKEAIALNAYDSIKRAPGVDPFKQPDYQGVIISKAFSAYRKIERKIRRTMEVQASQVMQTGIVSLIDFQGDVQYSIDYKPKATHFPTAGTAWANIAAPIIADLLALATVIRSDGLSNPDVLIMGEQAFENTMKNTEFKSRFDVRRIELGRISPMVINGEGGQFRGVVEIGTYMFDVWTYGGRFNDPQTGVSTAYIDPNKVIMLSSAARFDATFGAIPRIVPPESRVMRFLPPRMNRAGGVDLFANAWVSPDGEQLFAGLGSRPLMIPTAIDTFGCITTD